MSQSNSSLIADEAASLCGATPLWLRLFSFIIAILLLVSAALKAYFPTEAATLATAYQIPIWLTAIVVQFEIFVAVMLLGGLWQATVLRFVAVMFVAFAAFSGYRAWQGAESCGCFGPVKVPPAFTLALDGFVAVAAAIASLFSTNNRVFVRQVAAVAGAYAIVGALAATIVVQQSPVTASGRQSQIEGGLIILEPESWIGGEFPIAAQLDPPVDTSTGSWIALLFHHDCPDCQAAIPKYDALALSLGEAKRVLLIEVPPYGVQPPAVRAATTTRLSDRNDWFVQAPVEVSITNGRVVGASLELPAISQLTGHSDVEGR